MSPRVAIGGLQHETNTFARLQTTLEDFIKPAAWPGLTEGEALTTVFQHANIPISGFINAASDWDLVPLFWAQAEPAGYVEQSAFDHLAERMITKLSMAGDVDAIYLDLHGAMVTREYPDAEAELLYRIRQTVGPDLPVAVSLDLHGNLSPAFFELASCVTIYRTYPHIDMAETGARAQQLLAHLLEHRKPFARAMRQLDYIIPITAQTTRREPAQRLYAELTDNPEGVLSVDIAMGFPPADIPDNGPCVMVYGTDQQAVDKTADKVLASIKLAEKEFHNPLLPTEDAVKKAMLIAKSASKPVVIADPQDNPGAGGVGNTTGILKALLDAGACKTALSIMWDPISAKQAHEAGQGRSIEITLGGKAGEAGNLPLQLTTTIEQLSDGVFDFRGAMYQGSTGRLGPCACLLVTAVDGVETGSEVRIVVVSIRCQNADLALFSAFGIDPEQQEILVVKSAVHFLDAYEPVADTVLFAKAQGDNPCDLEELPFTQLRPGLRIGS